MNTNPYRHLRVTEIPVPELSANLAGAAKFIWLAQQEDGDTGALQEAIWYLQQELESRGDAPASEEANHEPEPAEEELEPKPVKQVSTSEPAKAEGAEEREPERTEPKKAEPAKAVTASTAAKFADPVVTPSKARSGPPRKRATPAEPPRKSAPPPPDYDDDDDDF